MTSDSAKGAGNCYHGSKKTLLSGTGLSGLQSYNAIKNIDPFGGSSAGYYNDRKRRDVSYQSSYDAPDNVIDVGKVIVMPPLGVAPNDVPQFGQPDGGAPPETDPYTASMAPEGTVPVAVFPPFSEYKKYPTKCVVFSELTDYEKGYSRPTEPFRVSYILKGAIV